MFIYVASRGDQLRQIAETYGVSPESIIRANGLPNPNNLLTGQALIIPTAEPILEKADIGVNGYLYFLGEAGTSIVNENARQLTSWPPLPMK